MLKFTKVIVFQPITMHLRCVLLQVFWLLMLIYWKIIIPFLLEGVLTYLITICTLSCLLYISLF